MLQISNLKLPPIHGPEDIYKKVQKEGVICCREDLVIEKKSLDARKKQDIHYLYTVSAKNGRYTGKHKNPNVQEVQRKTYQLPEPGSRPMRHRPLVVGAGPAGLFAALMLAEQGYCPILIERGAPVEERTHTVQAFWKGDPLNPESNVQFGEGGAGTFSDGKLNTQVKETAGRIRKVLEIFVESGADPSILYWHKPHIGTDVLQKVVYNLRNRILDAGGSIFFHTRLKDMVFEGGALSEAVLVTDGKEERIPVETLVLAIGHSARDTFSMLHEKGVPMEAKSFAVGLRVEHPQVMIQQVQYGSYEDGILPVADYKVTAKTSWDRGVYSFCMCPGGQVVNASSEPGYLAVNGMSRSARDGRNANSALIVSVTPKDYPGDGPLAGIRFQRELERLAYQEGRGKIPIQLYQDFKQNCPTTGLGDVLPDLCGDYSFGNLRKVLPEALSQALLEGMEQFGRRIPGFDRGDAVFSGVESRTSSPVRIKRDEHLESEIKGLYPCGEGAGYAGGITSAAVDGIRIAEEIIRRYRSWT